MIYKATVTASTKLLSIPESGMGYQIFEAIPNNDRYLRRYVAFNSELIIEHDVNFSINKQRIIEKGFSAVLNESNTLLLQTETIKLASKSIVKGYAILNESTKRKSHRLTGGKGATDNPIEKANGTELFVRLSAYENDKRIDIVKMKLTKGSFATTYLDYFTCYNNEDDPVDRYSLPYKDKIEWAFYILPDKKDTFQRGIVQPAFEHAGGGIEAYFENGTSENTYLMKREYGK